MNVVPSVPGSEHDPSTKMISPICKIECANPWLFHSRTSLKGSCIHVISGKGIRGNRLTLP